MGSRVINIANDFSRYPGGRFYTDGPFSGEQFRQEFLIPVLNSSDKCSIVFDGARGYGSSFLEEAFGGLVRIGYSAADVLSKFQLVSESDPSLVDEVLEYITKSNATS